MDGHASRVFAVRFHPSDPTSFVSAGWDDTVQVGILLPYKECAGRDTIT